VNVDPQIRSKIQGCVEVSFSIVHLSEWLGVE